jgi:hypothetical protein
LRHDGLQHVCRESGVCCCSQICRTPHRHDALELIQRRLERNRFLYDEIVHIEDAIAVVGDITGARSVDTELRLDAESDTLYDDGIDIEGEFDTLAGTAGSSGTVP